MEGLDLLKQEWKKQDASLPKYKKSDFYPMLLKRSSSIVKWIFYISVIEFVLWTILNVTFALKDDRSNLEALGLVWFDTLSYVISYGVLLYFMARFYLNYRRINSNDSVKGLMDNIIHTRRTVKHYVWFNLLFFTISFIVVSSAMYSHDTFNKQGELPTYMIVLILAATLIVILGLLVLFYRIIYGILTRKLKKNYAELKKIESTVN